ncbi:MAG TPA: glycerate kinase [Clostridiaceae bacterium]|jgi:glycerate kinase|nr:glycerate kinase [Clostridiaceae bacterium]
MKKIVITPDSFKGTMNSSEICDIAENAIKRLNPGIETVKIPVADGGEGTVEAFLKAVGGYMINLRVKGPLMDEIDSFYGILDDGVTAVIEMAAASGLPLIEDRKDPVRASTYGTGQLILDALNKGCKKIIIGVGGSATNDGGIGMAAALGVRFLDSKGNEVELNGRGLGNIEYIDISGKDKRIDSVQVLAACDVDNPLYGPNGAAFIYAPQKGADEETVRFLDNNLRHYAQVVERDLGINIGNMPGGGAAGGLGAALAVFAGARLKPGINIMLDTVNFQEIIKDADFIITGEGKIDGQSLRGKVPIGIAQEAKKAGVPVIVVAGDVGDDIEKVYESGISAVFSINRLAIPFEKARLRSKTDYEKTIESIIRFALTIEKGLHKQT